MQRMIAKVFEGSVDSQEKYDKRNKNRKVTQRFSNILARL